MEGSFWRLGHDLAELYRDHMTIRQLWVRLLVVLGDASSPLCLAIERDRRDAEDDAQVDSIDDALAMVGGG